MHVRKGPNNIHLSDFLAFKNICDHHTVSEMFENKTLITSWAKGIIVFDDVMDKLVESLINTEVAGQLKESLISYTSIDGHDHFTVTIQSSLFHQLSKHTKVQVTKYLWNKEANLFFDYNCLLKEQSVYESVTCLWALWAGLASREQADLMVPRALKLFEVEGGLVSGTEGSRGLISLERPNRQWDYPYGWAPHQIMAWKGLQR